LQKKIEKWLDEKERGGALNSLEERDNDWDSLRCAPRQGASSIRLLKEGLVYVKEGKWRGKTKRRGGKSSAGVE